MIKRSPWLALAGIAALSLAAALLAFVLLRTALQHAQAVRGLGLAAPAVTRPTGSPYGVNVSLHKDQENLELSLDLAQQGGFDWLRQRFPWVEIEPERGVYRWETYDRLVDAATGRGLKLIAVLDTSPAWARAARIDTAPPDNLDDYGRFVAEFVRHYSGRVGHIQIWDQPNVAPNWGEWWASPDEYVAMLKIAYGQAKTADPNVVVLAGGLAPTIADDLWNLNDVTFLRRMYAKGARGHFDVLAAKPYGFWSGPDDRRVNLDTLNFSRLILLREVMIKNGDVGRPVWAVEMGWNALPAGWAGEPAPWGSDAEETQARRLSDALRRAQSEWGWLHVFIINGLRFPSAAAADPVHGFALVDDSFAPRPAYRVVQSMAQQPPVALERQPASYLPLYGQMALIVLVVLACLAGVAVLMPALPWRLWDDAVDRLPLPLVMAAMALAALLYYRAPWLPLAGAAALAFAALAVARLDLALVITALTFPFYLYPRPIAGQVFSLPEALTIVCVGAWLARGLGQRQWGRRGSLSAPALFFAAVAILSLGASNDVRLSLRELRVVVVEPALFYVMAVAAFDHARRSLPRSALVWALVLGAAAAATQALGQYLFTDRVITAEGVRRALGPYGSPNNLGLLLERMLPLALALVARGWGDAQTRRHGDAVMPERGGASTRHSAARSPRLRVSPSPRLIVAACCLLLIAAALFLTYSVGAWLGAAAGLLVFAALRGRRQLLALLLGLAIAVVVLLPVLKVERVASHLDLRGETTANIRLDLWRSSLAMLADHPWQGVGLDGFLDAYRGVYIRPTALREPWLSHPHNLALEWWLFLGILGVPALLWLLVGFIYRGWRSLSRLDARQRILAQGAIAAMAAAVTHGLVDRFYFGAPDLAFVFFALLAVVDSGCGPRVPNSPRVRNSGVVHS